jgi:DGQHR domain-containing protein
LPRVDKEQKLARTKNVAKEPPFELTRELVKGRFGSYLDLGPAIVSQNLNLLSLRGSSSLAALAIASGADTYDVALNPNGTQRSLKPWHAAECYDYAIKSTAVTMIEEPHAFPEVMLNLADSSVAEFYDPKDSEQVIDFDSAMNEEDVDLNIVGVRFLIDSLELPKPIFKPQVSRIDGNHRLSGMDNHLQDFFDGDLQDDDIPVVPYSLFVNLKDIQVTRLFYIVNEKHEGMDAALTSTQEHQLADPQKMRTDPTLQPLWLTYELMKPGRSFHNKVNPGGSALGMKQQDVRPAIKSNALRGALTIMLRDDKPIKRSPDLLLMAVDNYWKAIAAVFHEAWNNKRDFILLQSIGLNAFALLGSRLLQIAIDKRDLSIKSFEALLDPIHSQISLTRKDPSWEGVAGAGGATKVYNVLVGKLSAAQSEINELERLYFPPRTLDERLDKLGETNDD